MKKEVYLFVIGGFLGWLLDTFYRSMTAKAFSHAGYLEAVTGITIPFLPVYGFGLILVILIREKMKDKNILTKAAVYAASLTALEFIAGIFTIATINSALWDYSQSAVHFKGIIDITHTLLWTLLAITVDTLADEAEKNPMIMRVSQ